jgi:hypothetical protein
MHLPIKRTHAHPDQTWDDWLCALPTIDVDHDDSGCVISSIRECGAELYVKWEFMVPISTMEIMADRDVPTDAVSSAWELVCTEGHVLATSANQRNTRDSAEDFDPSFVFGVGNGTVES